MADGTRLRFHGLITLPLRVRSVQVTTSLVVCALKEDAILGMPFLVDHRCEMDFQQPTLVVNGQRLVCTDREGRPLVSKMQILRTTTLPPQSEILVGGRLTTTSYQPVGLIEGANQKYMVAASLLQPDERGRVAVRCMNPTDHPVDVTAGSILGHCTGVKQDDIGTPWTDTDPVGSPHPAKVTEGPRVPTHLHDLYQQAVTHCSGQMERQKVEELLCRFADVFSRGSEDMGCTTLVRHEIPVSTDAQPIRQPPYRVGPEKEAEIEHQVAALAKPGMIEPAHEAWSSSVVLVRKKDGAWRLCRTTARPHPSQLDSSCASTTGS
ncbi:uncharacterized protein [Watersipora subatra]|uniref:uncharacterized protein n=1 Tax=Watersipora subatra TaxID=2589382 RepID=UPI00355BB7CB